MFEPIKNRTLIRSTEQPILVEGSRFLFIFQYALSDRLVFALFDFSKELVFKIRVKPTIAQGFKKIINT
jgi:hypothetical protein